MAEIDGRNSISGKLGPSRVRFVYFYPLQKSQQEIEDPENPTKSLHNNCKAYDSSEIETRNVTKSQQKSCCPPKSIDGSSEYSSFLSVSIQLPKIRKKYLDDYLFIKNLGRGTFGRVQKLRSKVSSEIYAGKTLLKTPNSSANRYKNKKLQDEINIYQKLNHPNIPQLHQIYSWKNQYTLILQYARGQNLNSLSREFSNNQSAIAHIMYQIFDTLEYLHGLNIVHHDIKPENIIFDLDSQLIRIFDFGEAIQLNSSKSIISEQGGTFPYFAPECFKGINNTKIDMWASGLVLYYLLTGIVYFYDTQKHRMKKNILEKPILFQGHSWNGRKPQIKDLILKLLQRDSAKRISATEAKNHPWIVQNTKNWQNPSKKIAIEILSKVNRSCSIDKEINDRNGRKISADCLLLGKAETHNKVSRFCVSGESTLSRG